MKTETLKEPVEMISLPEAARRMSACANTLRNRIAEAKIVPDAILFSGSTSRPMPLFLRARLPALEKLVKS
ncbi:MAG: hypothetical protein ACLP2Y_08930 [Limisphaerales bacterium]